MPYRWIYSEVCEIFNTLLTFEKHAVTKFPSCDTCISNKRPHKTIPRCVNLLRLGGCWFLQLWIWLGTIHLNSGLVWNVIIYKDIKNKSDIYAIPSHWVDDLLTRNRKNTGIQAKILIKSYHFHVWFSFESFFFIHVTPFAKEMKQNSNNQISPQSLIISPRETGRTISISSLKKKKNFIYLFRLHWSWLQHAGLVAQQHVGF